MLECRPGLTGLAQVNSYDGMSIEQKVGFDAKYAKSITLLSDMKIILKTLKLILFQKKQYKDFKKFYDEKRLQ